MSAIAVLGFVASAGAGNLDSRLSNFRVSRRLPACGIVTLIVQLARAGEVPMGFERTPECMGLFPRLDTSDDLLDLSGATIRGALDAIMSIVPSYQWREVDHIAVIRPILSWTDATMPLNLPARAFPAWDALKTDVLERTFNVSNNERVDWRLPANFSGSIADALTATIRAHGELIWDAGVILYPSDSRPFLMIDIRTLDGGKNRPGQARVGVSVLLDRLRANQ
jgi:hypothetical protein